MSQRERIKVAVRVRPLLKIKTEINTEDILKVDQNAASVLAQKGSITQQYTYDYAFPQDCTQLEIYEQSAKEIIDSFLEGYNGTIFAYGQTGSGKTYTMYGIGDGPIRGILPRSISQIFDFVNEHKSDTIFNITTSYVQLYEDQILDLLNNDLKNAPKIILREDRTHSFRMENNIVYPVKSIDEMKYILTEGSKNRKVRKTSMNVSSTRAHTILTIWIKQQKQDKKIFSRLNLVDLAGSESIKKAETEGEGVIETAAINSSLLVLGTCISALTSTQNKMQIIPYRESSLTKILKDSLGGNARTLMIATLSPSSYNLNETLNTMWYAQRAKLIKNKAIINMDPKDSLIAKYKSEVQSLQNQISKQRKALESNDVCEKMISSQKSDEQILRFQISKIKDERKSLKHRIKVEEDQLEKELYHHGMLLKMSDSNYQYDIIDDSNIDDGEFIDNTNDNYINESQNDEYYLELKNKKDQLKHIKKKIKEKKSAMKKTIEQMNDIGKKLKEIVKSNISKEELSNIYRSSFFDVETQQWKLKSDK
ncbi:Kinesin-like protein kif3a [Tritrichomonas musculus]|uniref:Kinesin-like protein n=1 Tax=Tritrichomonas musculus TaxID=1915356 RepID=A0ABR2K3W5_9EUKA